MKTKILIAVATIGCLLAVGCRKDHDCTYSHLNRAPKYIGDTPLTVLEIAENYFQLAEGDTLILSGYVNSISQNPHQVHPNYEWISMLGVSDMKNYVDPCWGYSVEGQNQLAALYKEEWNKESHYILLDKLQI